MRYSQAIIDRARQLRSRGNTYSEIFKVLGIKVPKSTISGWCKNVKLPSWYQNKVDSLNHMNLTKGQKMAWASHKRIREQLLKNLMKQNLHLKKKLKDKDILKMILAFLYLGEGSKWKASPGLALGNSDPNVIRLYIRLLKKCFGISSKILKCRISYRADQDIYKLQQYWSRITEIPIKNFYKTKPDPRTIGKPTRRKEYKGVCQIYGGRTNIQLELETIPRIILKGL